MGILCRRIFAHVGRGVNIQLGVRFGRGALITICEDSYLVSMATISIGKDVMIAPQVMILTGGHAFDIPHIRLID